MLATFWWRLFESVFNIDLGAQGYEFLYIVSGYLTAYNRKTTGT